ncbi:hypothetical protein Tco_0439993 [Tanacetum coccineum]
MDSEMVFPESDVSLYKAALNKAVVAMWDAEYVVEVALHSRIQRFEDKLMDLKPRISMETHSSFTRSSAEAVKTCNGSPKLLDPQQERQAQFSTFYALRNLSWDEVLRKGTKYYSEEFSRFCDQKMSGAIKELNWTRPCPALGILRVDDTRSFDGVLMEDAFVDRQ